MMRLARLTLLTTASLAVFAPGIFPPQGWASPSLTPLQEQTSDAVLGNADVIKMVQAHLSADIIVGQIQSSPCRFSLTANSLIALKQAGVPDKVIAAMQAKAGGAAPAGSASGGHTSPAITAGREYTAPEFEKLLPGILSKAAVAHGLAAHDYDKEEAYIGKFLDTCALDSTNVKVQMPNPRLPQYDICQRRTYQHTHIAGLLDVSVAAGNSHREGGAAGVARGDLLMDVGQPPNQWWPGQAYTITLKILVDQAAGSLSGSGPLVQNRLDTVLEGARIKGHAPRPVEESLATAKQKADSEAGASQGASGTKSSALASMPAGAFPVVDPASNDTLGNPLYILPLLYLRNTPGVFKDLQLLQSFVGLASCREVQVSQLKNEFGETPLAAFYRDNAAKILANIPSTFTERATVSLGEYDFSAGVFPIKVPNGASPSLDHVQFYGRAARLRQCTGGLSGNDRGSFELPIAGGRPYYEVDFSPVLLDRIAMDQASARSFIEQHPNRQVTVVFTVEVSGSAPKIVAGSGRHSEPTVLFAGRLTSVAIYDKYPDGKAIAVINPGDRVPQAAGVGTGASPSVPAAKDTDASPGSAANSPTASTPSPSSSSPVTSSASGSTSDAALPPPAIHDGVAGKALMNFLDKCSKGDAKGCEMVGFDVDKGWGADKDPQVAKAYYQKACSLGRKSDCNK